jgi:cyclohexyl-isocyanide hydratase
MKVAFIVYDGFNLFELAGVLEPLERLVHGGYLDGLEWHFCSLQVKAAGKGGLEVSSLRRPESLAGYDAVVVPGGPGLQGLLDDAPFLDWLRTAEPVRWKVAVSTGSLALGSAGLLKGRKAATHPDAVHLLAPYCREATSERILEDGDCITAGAVGASLDLGLYLCRRWGSDEADVAIRYAMDYRG